MLASITDHRFIMADYHDHAPFILQLVKVGYKCREFFVRALVYDVNISTYTMYTGRLVEIEGYPNSFPAGVGNFSVYAHWSHKLLRRYVGEFAVGLLHGKGVLWHRTLNEENFQVREGIFFNNRFQCGSVQEPALYPN